MRNSIFCVDDEPYCVWDPDIASQTKDFLKGLDPEFFDYSIEAHLKTEDEKRASVALRLTLHHSLETFFSLVGAYVQAHDCPYAWISKAQTKNIRSVTEKICSGNSELFTKLKVERLTWPSVASLAFSNFMPDTDRQRSVIDGFSKLWHALAHEFLDPIHSSEYNSLKHGFRVQAGGFALAMGKEPFAGTPPPEEDMHVLGKSDFGSSFLKVEPLTKARNERSLAISRQLVNWSLERIILMNKAAYMSINNICTALKIANGFQASECKFIHPVDGEDFLRAWSFSPGVTNLHWSSGADESNSKSTSRQELLDVISNRKDG